MKTNIVKLIYVCTAAVLSALFVVILYFCVPSIDALPEATGSIEYRRQIHNPDGTHTTELTTSVLGKDLTAVRISDLTEKGKITKVNYVGGKFVKPAIIDEDIQIVDLTKSFNFAEKGTLIFVILNLDPTDEDFFEQREALDKYKIGDYWNFEFSLPKVFCASNVYEKSTLVARHGDIENYNFIDYNTSYDIVTEDFSMRAESTSIDLRFYTRRETMEDALNAARIITVHYQSTGSALSGIAECPVIGTDAAVAATEQYSSTLLTSVTVLTAVVLVVFVVLSVLKRTREFAPAIVWTAGIALLFFSHYYLSRMSAIPLVWAGGALCASFVIIAGVLLSLTKNVKTTALKYIFTAVAASGVVLAFIRPFAPYGAAVALGVTCTVIKAACTILLIALIGYSLLGEHGKNDILETACAAAIAVSAATSLFLPYVYPAHLNPSFILCAAAVIMTFISVFFVFMETEKANAYLTANLNLEVERQIKDIKAVVNERDDILRFVSHDMRKPLSSSLTLLDVLTAREKDGEQIKALKIVRQNTARVVNNLSEIYDYAKFNYVLEKSQPVNLREIFARVYEFHNPDCIANAIVLKNLVEKDRRAFAKPQALENALSNIIMNAVEHAACSAITLSLKTVKNKVVLCVADNGKGIDGDIDVFKPYVSENKPETGGLGLYICKNIVESMNGELTYKSDSNGTEFYITLLKA